LKATICQGWNLLVRLCLTAPGALSVPEPELTFVEKVPDFQGLPHASTLLATPLASKQNKALVLEDLLGYGASSTTSEGKFEGNRACIKVAFSPSSASSFDGRQLQPQVRNEIAVLQELSGIVGVPTELWSRDLK
jgi:hypothetical protein